MNAIELFTDCLDSIQRQHNFNSSSISPLYNAYRIILINIYVSLKLLLWFIIVQYELTPRFALRVSKYSCISFVRLLFEPQMKVTEQAYSYFFNNLLIEIGGSMGLFLGFSLLDTKVPIRFRVSHICYVSMHEGYFFLDPCFPTASKILHCRQSRQLVCSVETLGVV